MENKEVWRPVLNFEQYEASNYGKIRNKKTGRILSPAKSRGYLVVNLCTSGKYRTHLVHRLVFEAFNGKISKGMQINHLNEIKTDNRICNIEVCTPKENINYGTHNIRVAEKRSKPVIQLDKKGNFIKEYPSTREADRQSGIPQSNICRCISGKIHSAGGYLWQYKH